MIYVLAFFLPPLALLLNGQIFAAIFNAIFFVLFLVLGILFFSPWLWLIAPLHAIVAIAMRREDRKHRELVAASGKYAHLHRQFARPGMTAYRGNSPVRVSTMQQADAQPEKSRHFTSHQL